LAEIIVFLLVMKNVEVTTSGI